MISYYHGFKYRIYMAIALSLVAVLLAGCQPGQSDVPEVVLDEDGTGLAIYGLNYTDVPIGVFYVNGVWGGNVSPYAAGYSSAGGIGLPASWRPGIKVKVQWRDDRIYTENKTALMMEEVEVPEYGKIYSGFLLVAFLPGRQVKVYASSYGPGHPNTAGGLMNPGEFCLQQPGCISWYRSGQPPREGHY